MRRVEDTFLHLLADNLIGAGTTVNPLRRDSGRTDGDVLKSNSVNVSFVECSYGQPSSVTAIIDILNDDELVATTVQTLVWQLLNARYFTELLDYSVDFAHPTKAGSNVFWNFNGIRFASVANSYYTHLTCRLTLYFHAQ